MPSLRTVTLIGVNLERRTLVCDPIGPYQLTTRSRLWGVGPTETLGRRLGRVAGEEFDGQRFESRPIAIPILVNAADEQGVDEALGELGGILDPSQGECRIVYERPDGTRREISARYEEGGDAVLVEHNETRYVRVPLIFRAQFPFWRPADGTDPARGGSFTDAWFAGSDYVQVVNEGDVAVWPRFRFVGLTGSFSEIEVHSLTAGRGFRLPNIFPVNSFIDIDTDPRDTSVELDLDPAFQTVMDPWSQFFQLRPGVNNLILRARGESTGGGAAGATGNVPIYQIFWRHLYHSC